MPFRKDWMTLWSERSYPGKKRKKRKNEKKGGDSVYFFLRAWRHVYCVKLCAHSANIWHDALTSHLTLPTAEIVWKGLDDTLVILYLSLGILSVCSQQGVPCKKVFTLNHFIENRRL